VQWQSAPNPLSLDYSGFAKWFCSTYGKHGSSWLEQFLIYNAMRQGRNQTVRDFVTEMERQRVLVHDLKTLYDDGEDRPEETTEDWPPPLRETRMDRDRFIAGLREPISSQLNALQLQSTTAAGYNEAVRSLYPPETLERRRQNGFFEFRLENLHKIAEDIEAGVVKLKMAKEQQRLLAAQLPAPRPQASTQMVPSSPFRQRVREPRVNPRFRLVNNHSMDDDEHDESLPAVEVLYQKLSREGKVLWSRAQLKVIFDRNLCFKCAKAGHKSSECTNPPVNPAEFRFTNLTELEAYEDDESLFYALQSLDVGPGNGAAASLQ